MTLGAIVVPDDFPLVLTGTPAESQLRALGPPVRIFAERGADDEAELIRAGTAPNSPGSVTAWAVRSP